MKQMKQNYKIYLAALLLVGAASMMTAGAQTKPTLAVFVVGSEAIGASLTTALGADLTSDGRYALTTVSTSSKFAELKAAYTAGGGSSINRDALAAWGYKEGIDAICLVVDDVKGNDHLFSAQLIDTKERKLSGKGSYVRTGVGSSEVARVSLALAKQLEGPERKRNTPTPTRSYPAELDMEMVLVEGGTNVLLGHRDSDGPLYTANYMKGPYTVASLPSFRIGKFEVTQAQWRKVMAGDRFENFFYWGGSRGVVNGALNDNNCGNVACDDQRPVEYITWYMALYFCNKLSEMVGLKPYYTITGSITDLGQCPSCTITENTNADGYRLPTYNQWEYAARGCKASNCEAFPFSGSNTLTEVGWHGDSGRPAYANSTTHPVGQLKPNRLGIYDMSGNVWEWTITLFDNGPDYTMRGGANTPGSWGWHHIASRGPQTPNARNSFLGIRLVLPAQ
jgi:formylglycine-generating enzyme required for sulfatase activity